MPSVQFLFWQYSAVFLILSMEFYLNHRDRFYNQIFNHRSNVFYGQ